MCVCSPDCFSDLLGVALAIKRELWVVPISLCPFCTNLNGSFWHGGEVWAATAEHGLVVGKWVSQENEDQDDTEGG